MVVEKGIGLDSGGNYKMSAAGFLKLHPPLETIDQKGSGNGCCKLNWFIPM